MTDEAQYSTRQCRGHWHITDASGEFDLKIDNAPDALSEDEAHALVDLLNSGKTVTSWPLAVETVSDATPSAQTSFHLLDDPAFSGPFRLVPPPGTTAQKVRRDALCLIAFVALTQLVFLVTGLQVIHPFLAATVMFIGLGFWAMAIAMRREFPSVARTGQQPASPHRQ